MIELYTQPSHCPNEARTRFHNSLSIVPLNPDNRSTNYLPLQDHSVPRLLITDPKVHEYFKISILFSLLQLQLIIFLPIQSPHQTLSRSSNPPKLRRARTLTSKSKSRRTRLNTRRKSFLILNICKFLPTFTFTFYNIQISVKRILLTTTPRTKEKTNAPFTQAAAYEHARGTYKKSRIKGANEAHAAFVRGEER